MCGLRRINTEQLIDQFICIWTLLQNVQLTEDPDTIVWNPTASGVYSASSAYGAQFVGRIRQPELESVWSLKVEGKVKFFIWLMLQNRNWTADRLQARGWPHDDACCLCDQQLETAFHLALECPYAKEVWFLFAGDQPAVARTALSSSSIEEWWSMLPVRQKEPTRRKMVTLSIYVVWNIWKERGRRIFQQLSSSPTALAVMVREDVSMLELANHI